jgi:hypothetical protein
MESNNDKKFSLSVNKTGKVVNAMVQGLFQPEDANQFVVAYKKIVGEIKAEEYELHFDSTNLKVNTQDMIPMLSACFEMYKKDNFKKIIFDCGSSATLKMQLRRVAGNVGLNYEVL